MKRLVSLRLAMAVAAVVVGTTVWNEDVEAQRRGGRGGGARGGGGRSGGFSRGGGSRGFSRGGSRGFSRSGGSRGFSRSRGSGGFSRSRGSSSFSRGGSSRGFSRGSSSFSRGRSSSGFRGSSSSGLRRSSGFSRSSGGSSIRRGSSGSISRSGGSRRSSGINLGSRGSINRGSRSGRGSSGLNLGSRGSGRSLGSSARSGRWNFDAGGSRGRSALRSGSGSSSARSGIAGRGGRGSGRRGSSGIANSVRGSGSRGSIGRGSGIGRSGIGRSGVARSGGINRGSIGRGGSGRGGFGRGGRNAFSSRWVAYGGRGGRGFGFRGGRGGLRNSWGFWLSGGYGGWGLGFGRGFGGFGLGGFGLGGFGLGGFGYGWPGYGGFGYGGFGGFYPSIGYFDYPYIVPVGDYYNPYCDVVVENYFPTGGTVVYDYSQPVVGSNAPNDAGVNSMAAADEAFRAGNYTLALAEADKAVKAMPNNSDVHQFRSLVLFAMGDYQNAAETAHAALMGGPGWNWETLRSFYPSVDAYTVHLRALERHRSVNKTATDARFLLAYHYMMMGHADAAADELVVVINNQPKDTLALSLLNAISKQTGKEYQLEKPRNLVPPTPPTPRLNQSKPLLVAPKPPADPQALAAWKGTWKATQADGTTITLELLAGGKFRWTAENGENKSTVAGTFTLENDQLQLSGSRAGQVLQGTMSPSGKDAFGLKLKYQPEGAPDLAFKRQ